LITEVDEKNAIQQKIDLFLEAYHEEMDKGENADQLTLVRLSEILVNLWDKKEMEHFNIGASK
jgi:hypothetical protein